MSLIGKHRENYETTKGKRKNLENSKVLRPNFIRGERWQPVPLDDVNSLVVD